MAKQDNEEKGGEGGGGIMSGLKKVGGGFVKAANLAQMVSQGVIQANPIIMTAGKGAMAYSGYRHAKDIKAGVPEEDRYPIYNPYAYQTAALHKGFDAVSGIVRKVTGREGAKEPSEFPEETAQLEAVTEQPEAISTPTESDTESSDRAVNYGLTNGSSEAGMLQSMDEGVGSEQKYDRYGYKTDYEGEYDNANEELRAGQEGKIELSDERYQYLESQWRKADDDNIRAPGSQNPSFQNATAELNWIKEHGFKGSNQEKADYIRQLYLKIEKERRARTSSAGGSTRTTASRPGYDASNNRGITGALEISAIPHARSQELQNGRIVLQGRSYDVVGNTGDKFLVPSPDQPDYSRRA